MAQNQTPGQGDSRELQMMKAVLPYVEQPQRQMFSTIIRLVKVQSLLSRLEQEEEELLSACSFGGGGMNPDSSREELLFQALKPFCSKREQEMLEMFQNFRMASHFYQEYQQNPDSEQKTEDCSGSGGHSYQYENYGEPCGESIRYGNNYNGSNETAYSSGSPGFDTGSGQSSGADSRPGQSGRSGGNSGRRSRQPGFQPTDLLKSMMPPEQQNMMDTMQMMMSSGLFGNSKSQS